jgi:ribosomal-protein-alanine N-acetyltransferase
MIRLATPDDAGVVTAVEEASFGADAWSATLVDLELIAPGRVVVLSEEDGVPVGYASAAVVADVADLTRIAVTPSARRAGLGRELLDDLLRRVADAGAERMMLEVADTNEPALGLYRVSGFVEVARRRDYYGRGSDAVVMELAPLAGRATLEA